ncbi:MAG TPA: hypothetical protein VGG29_14860 [Caulobacteraceae bacterium]|jgi:hypothetical protein
MADDAAQSSTVNVQAELTPQVFEMLKELAQRRGLDANTVLQQAITTEKLLSDNVGVNDEVLIRKPDASYSRVLFDRKA